MCLNGFKTTSFVTIAGSVPAAHFPVLRAPIAAPARQEVDVAAPGEV
jgi:hypothetical protein